jgi:hypothetical protein
MPKLLLLRNITRDELASLVGHTVDAALWAGGVGKKVEDGIYSATTLRRAWVARVTVKAGRIIKVEG